MPDQPATKEEEDGWVGVREAGRVDGKEVGNGGGGVVRRGVEVESMAIDWGRIWRRVERDLGEKCWCHRVAAAAGREERWNRWRRAMEVAW